MGKKNRNGVCGSSFAAFAMWVVGRGVEAGPDRKDPPESAMPDRGQNLPNPTQISEETSSSP